MDGYRAIKLIRDARELGRRRGRRMQIMQREQRLAAALDRCAQKEEDCVVFEIATRNNRTNKLHYLEIVHEAYGATNRFAVYGDGTKWRNGWSRTHFAKWLFDQIDSSRRDWS